MKNSTLYVILLFRLRFIQVLKILIAVLRGEISYYPRSVKKLESKFKFSTNTEHAIMFSNATSAMEAGLFALGIRDGKRVATTAFVIPSSYCPASYLGANIEFCDIDMRTLNLNEDALITKSEPNIDALIITHFYGNPCNMEKIMGWAEKNQVFVIEDCSHAHGASYDGRPLGGWGHIGIFSLQGAKAIAAGEGGMAVTRDVRLAVKMGAYGHQDGFKKFGFDLGTDEQFDIPPFGYGRKMRAHPLGAVLAGVDFQFLPIKNRIFNRWVSELENISKKTDLFSVPMKYELAKKGGYCQGVPLIFRDDDSASLFIKKAKKVKVNCFQRNYSDYIQYYASASHNQSDTQLSEKLPNTYQAFNVVVYIPFYQFAHPLRWNRLVTILQIDVQ